MSGPSLQLLVVSADPALRGEIEAALPAAFQGRVVLRQDRDLHSALETARVREPTLVAVGLERDLGALRAFTTELAAVAPGCVVVGVHERHVAAADGSESAFVIDAMRAGVRDFLRRPVSSTELQEVLARVLESAPAAGAAGGAAPGGRVVSFHSTKGGVGKSTLSISTACALAMRRPDRVLLVDASLQLGVCAAALDVEAPHSLVEAVRERDRLDPVMLHQLASPSPSGVRLLAAPLDAVEAAEVTEETFARIVTLARRAFDFVVIDTFPMLDGLILSALDLSDLVYVVNQGTVPDVIGAAQLLKVMDQIGIGRPRRRVVLNQNHPPFPGQLTARDVEERLGQEVDHLVPYEKRLLTALNLGEPYILRAPAGRGFGRALHAIADEVEALARPRGPATPEEDPVAGGGLAGALSLARRLLGRPAS